MKIQFVSQQISEIDVVALGLTFQRNEIKDVSEADGELLLRSGSFARVDDESKVATVTSSASSAVTADAKAIAPDHKPPIAAASEPKT